MKKFGVDRNGFIITEVSIKKISPIYKHVVTCVSDIILSKYAKDIESIYLYGSVVTGKAIKGKSDLDILLVFKNNPNGIVAKNVKTLEKNLSKKYINILRGIGLAITSIQEVKNPKEKYGLLCFIKHLCVCIYGNDITVNIPKFKPTKAVAKGFNGDIAEKLEINRRKFLKHLTTSEIKKLSQETSKRIIRTGFSLVMPRTKSWTTNLQKSVDTFIYYYPEKKAEMTKALEWSKAGTVNKQAIIDFIDSFGLWLSTEFNEQIGSRT
ncbi:MAG: nucleotidyltransferase domain-containing protein [Candidatus Micrarchaeaceae archaeon]|jgi:predicted nucleotidyltransferase